MPRIRTVLLRILFLCRGGKRFSGRADEHDARNFHFLLSAFLIWIVFMELLVIPLFAARKAVVSIAVLGLGTAAGTALVLLRRGHKRAAAYLFLSALWGFIEIFAALSGGIHGGSGNMPLVVVLIAAWLLGLSAAMGFAAVTLLVFAAEVLLEYTGHRLPAYFPGSPLALGASEMGLIGLGMAPIIGFVGALRRYVAALQEGKQRLEEAQELAHLGSYTSDTLTGRMEWSDELYRIYELDAADGEPSSEFVLTRTHPEDRALIQRRRADLIRQHGPFEFEHRLLMPDGRIKYLLVKGSVSRSGDGRPRTRATVQDITDRKHSEQEMMQLQAHLNQAQKLESVGRLAAGVAHEINTPIQYIGDNGKFLQGAFRDLLKIAEASGGSGDAAPSGAEANSIHFDEGADEALLPYLQDEVPRAIEQLIEGVDHVAHIVQAMKEFSHPGPGERTPVDINRAIATAVLVSRSEWKYVADLTTDFDPTLPPVLCPGGEFNQVIVNLIVNAAHAISDVVKDSARTGTIHITTRREADAAEIRVKDTGCGIPKANQPKVFDPFFTTKPLGKGTGQGLAIAYGVIVQKFGGTIRLESEPGIGTTFIIRLPLVSQPVAA